MSDGSTLYIQVVILNVATTCYAAAFMSMLVDFYYNRSAVKKIKKVSSFKDKLLFSKYKAKIPTLFYVYYYAVSIVNTVFLILCTVFRFVSSLKPYGHKLYIAVIVLDLIFILVVLIPFWNGGTHQGFKFERWLKK